MQHAQGMLAGLQDAGSVGEREATLSWILELRRNLLKAKVENLNTYILQESPTSLCAQLRCFILKRIHFPALDLIGTEWSFN